MKKIPMWMPPEYVGMFWFGIFATVVSIAVTAFDFRSWPAIPLSIGAILIGRYPIIKTWFSELRENIKVIICG